MEIPQQNFSYLPIQPYRLRDFTWEEVNEIVQNWVPPTDAGLDLEKFEIFEEPFNPVELEQVKDESEVETYNTVELEQMKDESEVEKYNPVEAKNLKVGLSDDVASWIDKVTGGLLFVFVAYVSARAMPHHPAIYS